MHFFFKKFTTIFKTDRKIYIHSNESDDKSIELEFNKKNTLLIEKILKEGVLEKQINKNPIYSELYEKGFLYDNPFFQNKKDIKRTEIFLNYLFNDLGEKELDEVKETKILVYGAGGAGSPLIYLLAQFGFKNITVIDFDKVEVSDIHRTIAFRKEDISKSKIEVLKRNIWDNFSININAIHGAYSEKKEIWSLAKKIRPDFIVNACDPKPSFKLDLNEICFEYKIPYITTSYSYESVLIGPIYVPTVTSCENSFDNDVIKAFGKEHSYSNVENMFSEFLVHPSNSFNINILASLGFKEILFFMLGKLDFCQTIGRRIIFNPLNYQITTRNAECDDSCSICFPLKN